jgi:hypothetical protein
MLALRCATTSDCRILHSGAQIDSAHTCPHASCYQRIDCPIEQTVAQVDSQPAQPYRDIDNSLDVARRIAAPGIQQGAIPIRQ